MVISVKISYFQEFWSLICAGYEQQERYNWRSSQFELIWYILPTDLLTKIVHSHQSKEAVTKPPFESHQLTQMYVVCVCKWFEINNNWKKRTKKKGKRTTERKQYVNICSRSRKAKQNEQIRSQTVRVCDSDTILIFLDAYVCEIDVCAPYANRSRLKFLNKITVTRFICCACVQANEVLAKSKHIQRDFSSNYIRSNCSGHSFF